MAPRRLADGADRTAEVARLQAAVDAVGSELRRTEALLGVDAASDAGDLVHALATSHHAVLADPIFIGAAMRCVQDEGATAEWALEQTLDELRARFARLARPAFRSWFRDVEGLCGELVAVLVGQRPSRYLECDVGDIVVANALTINDVITLIQRGAGGIVLEARSLTSHVAVLCRSAGLPAVTGVSDVRARVQTDQLLEVDGDAGTVQPATTAATPVKRPHQPPASDDAAGEHAAEGVSGAPAPSSSAMRVRANLDIRLDADWARAHGTAGVGLWRTFFLYLGRTELPSEDDLTARFAAVLADFAPAPVTIRLVDLSGPFADDELPAPLRGLSECRGVRLREERPGVLQTQIRALVRAAPQGDLRILVPFVTDIAEIAWVRTSVDAVRRDLRYAPPIPIGAMVEVPAVLFTLDALAASADFLAIGSNDLNALLLAQPRDALGASHGSRGLSGPAQIHPALLQAIAWVVAAGRRASIPVSLCGELASDPTATQQLYDAGLRELSLSPRLAPAVQRAIDALTATVT